MSREHNTVTIEVARNGYIVYGGVHRNMIHPAPYVFESFDSMTAWLEANYIKGEQPSDNGALP